MTARESEKLAAEAVVLQRESEAQAAQQRLVRTESLATKNAVSEQNLDDDRARAKSAEAAIKAAKARGFTVLLVEQNFRFAQTVADRHYVMEHLVDLGDVYLTFFLPETVAGRVALGSEVRLILDAAPQFVIPARVSYVASVAQFTPKTVETASERQKLMFRVKAQIDRGLLKEHLERVKTGLPGVAWVKIDAQAEWPSHLALKLPQ